MFAMNMKCPNCKNELEDAGKYFSPVAKIASVMWRQKAGKKVICIYCSAELELVLYKPWLDKFLIYLLFSPLAVNAFFPEFMRENRWMWLFPLIPWVAYKFICTKTQSYKVRSRKDIK
jgi:uncharacterized membrane protein